MLYTVIHIIHLLAAFVYGGFLFVDILFLSKMGQTLTAEEAAKAREAIMIHVRKVVPYALFVVVGTGIYMFWNVFGEVGDEGLTRFQMLLLIKAFLGLWLGIRGFNQKVFKINPWVFKSHYFPFTLVVIIIILSQLMWM
ncbi:hypothetical protein [Nitrosophilus alvini]|uniref:hypothetical protein n=1 Tax=Nitrosophilus alvini TaxID=2714855 RepID=UPI00190C3AEC|nr:hypothetical protein [Nitrosophilus alvini]